jgi:uncharacterized protein YecT (DUF1311 family)
MLIIIFAFALPFLVPSAFAIDCKKATSSVEKSICSDPKLIHYDAAMNIIYAKFKSYEEHFDRANGDSGGLVKSQKEWLSDRDQIADYVAQEIRRQEPTQAKSIKIELNPKYKEQLKIELTKKYENRLKQLSELIPGDWKDYDWEENRDLTELRNVTIPSYEIKIKTGTLSFLHSAINSGDSRSENMLVTTSIFFKPLNQIKFKTLHIESQVASSSDGGQNRSLAPEIRKRILEQKTRVWIKGFFVSPTFLRFVNHLPQLETVKTPSISSRRSDSIKFPQYVTCSENNSDESSEDCPGGYTSISKQVAQMSYQISELKFGNHALVFKPEIKVRAELAEVPF